MKIGKKAAMAASLCIGAALLATTAFADISTKSGYDQLKDAIKGTAAFGTSASGSYTLSTTFSIKMDGNTVTSETTTEKRDYASGTDESTNISERADGIKNTIYSYSDKTTNIFKSGTDDRYYVTEYSRERTIKTDNESPFENQRWKDIERILDAAVGNLRDYIVVEDKPDGSKELSGSVNQTQIPALPNVLASYFYKQNYAQERMAYSKDGTAPESQGSILAKVSEDIFVKEISGRAVVGKDGYIQSILADGKLSGKDKAGIEHEIEIEALVKVQDIGNTVIQKPDLTGQQVERRVDNSDQNNISPKYIGTYTSDMVIQKNDAFVKIGERTVRINYIDDKKVSGKYTEMVLPEYKDYQDEPAEIDFDAQIKGYSGAEFKYIDSSGAEKTGQIFFPDNGTIQFMIPDFYQRSVSYNPVFGRVFDK